MNNKNILTMIGSLFTLLSLVFAGTAQAEITSPEEALYKASNIRMLTQRMLKNYTLIGQSIRARKAQQELDENITEFDSQLAELQTYVKDDPSRNNLRSVVSNWERLKPTLKATPAKKEVEAMREMNEALLQSTIQTVNSIKDQSQPVNGFLIDLTGQQAMLSQRIAGTYALMAWGYEQEYRQSYQKSYDDFIGTLELIESVDPTNVDIGKSETALKKIKRQFKRVKPANGDTFVPGLVDRSSEKLLKTINVAVDLYAGVN